MKLTNYLNNHKNEDAYKEYKPYINQLYEKIQDVKITESAEDSEYTSYSINKGEQIVFCLRSKQTEGVLHDLNLLMYVCIHEMSHVACPEYNHTPLFKKIFAFFTKVAIDIGIYKKIDFKDDPLEYCGLTISESII
jgi:predicted metal-dependent hydrolase